MLQAQTASGHDIEPEEVEFTVKVWRLAGDHLLGKTLREDRKQRSGLPALVRFDLAPCLRSAETILRIARLGLCERRRARIKGRWTLGKRSRERRSVHVEEDLVFVASEGKEAAEGRRNRRRAE